MVKIILLELKPACLVPLKAKIQYFVDLVLKPTLQLITGISIYLQKLVRCSYDIAIIVS